MSQIKDSAPGTAATLKKVYEEHLLPFEQQQARRRLAARLARVEPAAGLDGDASDHMAAQVLEAMLASGPVGYDDFSEDDPASDSDEPAPKRQKTKQEVRGCIASHTPQSSFDPVNIQNLHRSALVGPISATMPYATNSKVHHAPCMYLRSCTSNPQMQLSFLTHFLGSGVACCRLIACRVHAGVKA